MLDLKILFFSDAHFRKNGNYARKEVLDHLATYCSEEKPDLICFTGDLAQSGNAVEYSKVIESWKSLQAAVPKARIVWVPGNHDLQRSDIPLVATYLTSLSDSASIEEFLDITGENESLAGGREGLRNRFESWIGAARVVHSVGLQSLLANGMQGGCETIEINGWQVAINVLNTAFTALGDKDQGRLLVSRSLCHQMKESLGDAHLRILLAHHPRSWWHTECQGNWTLLQETHDFIFTGHEHQGMIGQTAATADQHVRCHFVAAGASDVPSSAGNNQIFLLVCSRYGDGKASFRARRLNVSLDGTGGVFPLPNTTTDELGWYPKTNSVPVGRIQPPIAKQDESPRTEQTADTSLPEDPFRFLKLIADDGDIELLSHQAEETSSSDGLVLYWPVRLRTPNFVHAVQTFIAAALAARGVQVHLCFDDLGRIDGFPNAAKAAEAFKRRVRGWALKVVAPEHADNLLSNCHCFSDYVGDNETGKEAKPGVLEALGKNLLEWLVAKDRLEEVLVEAKLMNDLGADLNGRPRRLLTPPVVWTVLQTLQRDIGSTSMILTLGGADERPIWRAFETVNSSSAHLTSILIKPVSTRVESETQGASVPMDSNLLRIMSQEDIIRAIQPDTDGRKEWFTKFGWHLPEVLAKHIALPLSEKLQVDSRECARNIAGYVT